MYLTFSKIAQGKLQQSRQQMTSRPNEEDGHRGTNVLFFLKKMGQSRPLFVYFRSFHIPIQMTNIQFEQYKLKKSVDGVLGTRTRGGMMEGADESTEL